MPAKLPGVYGGSGDWIPTTISLANPSIRMVIICMHGAAENDNDDGGRGYRRRAGNQHAA